MRGDDIQPSPRSSAQCNDRLSRGRLRAEANRDNRKPNLFQRQRRVLEIGVRTQLIGAGYHNDIACLWNSSSGEACQGKISTCGDK